MPKILILAANPNDTTRLRLGEEVRDIKEGLERSSHRDEFDVAEKWAVRTRDLQRAMLDETPQIVHFSGHGAGEAGLYFEDNVGNAKLVPGAALANLFKLFAQKAEISCVLLNGCYSQAQAEAIVEHIPYVIGMNDSMGDQAAIEFAVGFYDALGAGESVEFAFELGKSALALSGVGDEDVPVLLKGTVPVNSAGTSPDEGQPKRQPPVAIDPNQPLNVFISYSTKDEELKDELEVHLSTLKRQGKIAPWDGGMIEAGVDADAKLNAQIEAAHIILLLVTPRFLASEHIYDQQLTQAMERHDAGTARVIPIILKPVDLEGMPFKKLRELPRDGYRKSLTRWDNQDEAFLDVVQGIRQAVDALRAGPSETPPPNP